MKPIVIGQTQEGRDVTLDVSRLIETRMLIQSNSGGGKSWFLRMLLERTHGRFQQIVLDVEGEFATLRERYDYVLAARTGGDTLADVRTAALLARRLLELGVSAIVDLYELKAHERIRFVRLFLEAMVDAPKNLWHPTLVVIDEAHLFCPQRGEAESAQAVTDLMTRGRKRGFCGVLATQRLSKLHKDAAAEANVKIIGRAALDVDLVRASEELGLSKRDDQRELRTLKPGEFFGFGPGLSDLVVRFRSAGVETSHPKVGQRGGSVATPTSDTVRAVLGKLADLPKEAAEEAKTVDELRREVQRLRREAKAPAPAADPGVVAALKRDLREAEARSARMSARATTWRELAQSLIRRCEATGAQAQADFERINATAGADAEPSGAFARQGYTVSPPMRSPSGPPTARVTKVGNGSITLESQPKLGAERKLLVALVQRAPIRLSRAQLGTLCSLAHSGGTFGTYLSRLRSAGLIEEQGDLVTATEAGIEACGVVPPAPVGAAVLEMWLNNVGRNAAGKLLAVLAERYPDAMSRDELAEACNLTANAGTFGTYLSRLRSNALIVERDGTVAAAPAVMGEVTDG